VVARKSFGKIVSKWDLEKDSNAISDNLINYFVYARVANKAVFCRQS